MVVVMPRTMGVLPVLMAVVVMVATMRMVGVPLAMTVVMMMVMRRVIMIAVVMVPVVVVFVLGTLIVSRMFETPGGPPSYVAAFDKAFAPGFSVETRDTYKSETRVENVPFKVVDAGTLKLPSGQICAADPFVALSDTKPFTQQVPAGDFPVQLAVGEFPSGGSRVTFARVDFKRTPIARWSMAVRLACPPAARWR